MFHKGLYMSSRCYCCDRIIYGRLGWITLEDGTKVEESLCVVCRQEVKKAMYEPYVAPDKQFDGIVEQQMMYGVVTQPKKVPY